MRNCRQLQIALVFVWALAHGMWMGAVWHSAAASYTNPVAKKTGCLCRHLALDLDNTPALTAAPGAEECSVCALGTLAPDAPVYASFATPQVSTAFSEPAIQLSTPRDTQLPLPFGRGPPSLA